MNLFTINTIFIALATFITIKVLRFPMLRYANSKKRKRIAQLASLAAILVMVYPTITFVKVWKESGFDNDYSLFLRDEVESNSDLWFQKGILDTDNETITLYFNGEINEATETDLRNEIKKYPNIKEFSLKINGNKNRSFDRISDAYDRAINDLDKKDNIIEGLQNEMLGLKEQIKILQNEDSRLSFSNISKEAKIKFQDLEFFGFSTMKTSQDFISTDTVTVVTSRWKETLNDSIKANKNYQLAEWLQSRIDADTVVVLGN